MSHRRRRRRWVALGGLVGLLAVAVPVAWASHQFTDVPDASPFHGDIAAIKDAGITAGKTCVPPGTSPTYCPTEGITREAMAAFVHRGFGRVAQSSALLVSTIASADGTVDIGQVSIQVGGVGPGVNQFVRVEGLVTLWGTTPGCPCYFDAKLRESGGGTVNIELDQFPVSGYNQITMPVSYVFSATPGVHTYVMSVVTTSASAVNLANLSLSAETFAFGSSGANTLGEG